MIYDYQRLLCRRLLTWSALSLILGVVLLLRGEAFWSGFGLQAVVWAIIAAGIAAIGMRGLGVKLDRTIDPPQANREAARLRRILWINTGLDVLYIATGAIITLTLGQSDPFARGSGWGIVLQGGFLFLFDLLHALGTPNEVVLADIGLFNRPEHDSFTLPGKRGVIVMVHGFPGTANEVRDLANELQQAGWGVRGVLLPGFGRSLPTIYQQRAAGWIEAIAREVENSRIDGLPVVLLGFSMGGGLSVSAAARSRPGKLVLISPFWWNETLPLGALVGAVRLFLPVSLAPFKHSQSPPLQTREAARQVAPDINLDDPQILQAYRELRIPLILLEQFRQISIRARRNARHLQMPVLLLQGAQDPIAHPQRARRLSKLIGEHVKYVELPGEHHVILPSSPAFAQVATAIIDFLE
jgi:alpha-beta hydrolase superfamily lysophospholipase